MARKIKYTGGTDSANLILSGWFDEDLIVASSSNNVTVSLSGNAGTGSPGTLTISNAVPLTGLSGTSSVGTVSPSLAALLTGLAGTGALGTLTPRLSVALTGFEATGAVGTVTAPGNITVSLSGISGTGSVGSVSPATNISLSSLLATVGQGNLTAAFSFTLNGLSATSGTGTLIAANSVALAGNQATGSVGTVTFSTSVPVTAALTGVEATGSVGSVSPAFSVPITGIAASIAAGTITANLYSSLSGNAASSSVGTLKPSTAVAISNITGTGVAGTVTFTSRDLFIALSSQSITALAGTLSPSNVVGITGNSGTGSVGTTVVTPYIGLAGNTATGAIGIITETHSSNVTLSGVLGTFSTGLLSPVSTTASGIVPYLVGIPEGLARYLVNAAGMMIGSVLYSPSNSVAQGYVVSQSIPGGTTEPLWTSIQFTVSSGPQQTAPTATVPNLVGQPAYQAGQQAFAAGLTITTFLYATSPTVAAGSVISQSLTAGSVVPTGTNISLTISLGVATSPATTTVPNVTGLYLWDAVRILTAAQIIVEPWIYAASLTVTEEYVISQTLTAGQTVLTWSPIVIYVSSGVP